MKVRGTDPFLSWALSDPTFEARLVIYSNHERNISESFIRFQTSSSQSLGAQSLSSLLIWAGGRSDRARPPAHVLLAPFLNRRLPVKRRDMNQIAHVVENLWLPSTPRHPSLFFSNLKKWINQTKLQSSRHLTSKHFCYIILCLNYIV